MSSAARMPRLSSTPEYASVPVRSIVWIGFTRPSAGYLLFAPWGPALSKLSAREITFPLRTRRAAATMSSGVVWLSVPISSAAPQRPQFLYFSAACARSSRVSFLAAIAFLLRLGGAHRDRDRAHVDRARGHLVPIVLAKTPRLDGGPERRALGAQDLERRAFAFGNVGREAHLLDRRALLRLLVEAEVAGAARQHREQVDAAHDAAGDGDIAVEEPRRVADDRVELGAVAGIFRVIASHADHPVAVHEPRAPARRIARRVESARESRLRRVDIAIRQRDERQV